jgi:hypothetical protein
MCAAGMQPLTAEAEPFYADEEANWEPYTETQQEEEQQEHEFDEEYQRYLDEMSDAMLNDKALREEIIKELSSISSEDQLTKEDAELLRIASHLQDEEIRTELEEQERIVGASKLLSFFSFSTARQVGVAISFLACSQSVLLPLPLVFHS